MKINESYAMKEPSSICKNHILLIQKPNSLFKLDVNSLSVGTGKFAIVFGEKLNTDQLEKLLLQNNNYNNIIEIALFVPKEENAYSVFGRSLKNDNEIKILNIWKNGRYVWDSSVYPKGRMKNLKGNTIRATSFEYPPFNYRNSEKENEEYQGMEVYFGSFQNLFLHNLFSS